LYNLLQEKIFSAARTGEFEGMKKCHFGCIVRAKMAFRSIEGIILAT